MLTLVRDLYQKVLISVFREVVSDLNEWRALFGQNCTLGLHGAPLNQIGAKVHQRYKLFWKFERKESYLKTNALQHASPWCMRICTWNYLYIIILLSYYYYYYYYLYIHGIAHIFMNLEWLKALHIVQCTYTRYFSLT